ncbi:hypothetical protein ABI59_12415 [Acidobacteria bacterium Mor1]|nr:hypothetical protein ABI59_12415 [Acidobacteria bacterium Mor1]
MLAPSVAAQATGALTVTVADADGPLPGAVVTLENVRSLVAESSERSDTRGIVSFPVLPVGGGYKVTVAFTGYGTREVSELRVRPRQTTQVPITLAEEYKEEVRVVGRREVVDLDETQTSTKFSNEFIQDLPIRGRTYQKLLTLAPGVQDANDDGNPNVHGSRARDFKAVVGGVSNVDPLTGQFQSNVNLNAIEEIEVLTAGAGPEFGRAQGGYANIILKQGTNDFEGVVSYFYQTSDLDGVGAANLPDDRIPDFDWNQPSVQLSGPIIKDKLWYRLSHEYVDKGEPFNIIGDLAVVETEQRVDSDQLTWQVSPRNKLAFRFDANPITLNNFGVSSTTPASASQFRRTEADSYSIVWSAPYSPRVFVETLVAWQDGGLTVAPAERGVRNSCLRGLDVIELAACTNLGGEDPTATGDVINGQIPAGTTGSYFIDFNDARQRFTVKSDATIYPRGRFLGVPHEIKTGLIIENERYVRDIEQRPQIDFQVERIGFNLVGTALVNVPVPSSNRARATGTTWGIYFRDKMRIRSNLTLDVGFRLDRQAINSGGLEPLDFSAELQDYESRIAQGAFPFEAAQAFTGFEGTEQVAEELAQVFGLTPQQTISFFGPTVVQANFLSKRRSKQDINLIDTNFSPFLALSWDPWGDGKTKFSFSAGRNYNNIPFLVPLLEQLPAAVGIEFQAVRFNDEWLLNDLSNRRAVNAVASLLAVDHDLRTPYQDELAITFERQIAAETRFDVTYIRREYRDQLQDRDINNVARDLGTCLLVTEPGDPAINDQPDGLLDDCTGNLEPFPNDPSILLPRPDGFPDLYRLNPFWGSVLQVGNFNQSDYEAVVLSLLRRQYRGWEGQLSYTWSQSVGDGEDFQQVIGNDGSLVDDEFGFQSNDQRHVVKFIASTQTPWGVRLGGSVTWQSGLPFSLLRQGLSRDVVFPSVAGFDSFEQRERLIFPTGQRNDQRNRSFWDFTIKATKAVVVKGVTAELSLEVFNLLNDDTYRIYNEFLEIGTQINGVNDATRRFGRQYQLGVRVAF